MNGSMTGTLTDFLLARIADDKAVAEGWPIDGPWGAHPDGGMWVDVRGFPIYAPRARVLAECEARRRIVLMHQHSDYSMGNNRAECPTMARSLAESAAFRDRGGCDTLVALAAVYADHEDYRDEWRP